MRLKKISIDHGSQQKATHLFNEIATMQAYKMTPAEWKRTSRIDKKIMSYKLVMDTFYQDMARANKGENADRNR